MGHTGENMAWHANIHNEVEMQYRNDIEVLSLHGADREEEP
jgi:hypothetical protein